LRWWNRVLKLGEARPCNTDLARVKHRLQHKVVEVCEE